MNRIKDVKDQIDWSIVISGVVTAIILGGSIYAMKKAGMNSAASVIRGGV